MIDAAWITERRMQLQRDLRAACAQVDQLRGALALLEEVDVAFTKSPLAPDANGDDPTAP
jgi:hypothetical protein